MLLRLARKPPLLNKKRTRASGGGGGGVLEALCWKEDKATCNGKCTRIHDIGLDMYDVCVGGSSERVVVGEWQSPSLRWTGVSLGGSLGLDWIFDFTGESANAVPHTEKLRARVTHIWGNRRGQPNRSAMERPRPGRSAFLITDPPAPGKYAWTSADIKCTHLRPSPRSRP